MLPTEFDTVRDLPADVEAGIFVAADGTIGGAYGVTLDSALAGEDVAVAISGEAQVQAGDASFNAGEKVEVDANGRVVLLNVGTLVGVAKNRHGNDGAAAVGTDHKFVTVTLNDLADRL